MSRILCAASIAAAALAACRSRAPELAAPERPAAPSVATAEPAVPPALQHLHWTAYQQEFLLVQRATAPGKCTAVCTTKNGRETWSIDECLSTREELHFLSPDGDDLMVLRLRPEADDVQQLTTVGVIYRRGRVFQNIAAGDLTNATRVEGGRAVWMGQGEPRAVPSGVDVELIDGRRRVIRFDGVHLKALKEPPLTLVATPLRYGVPRRHRKPGRAAATVVSSRDRRR